MASFSKEHSYLQEGNASNSSWFGEASEKGRAESMNDGAESSSLQQLQLHPFNQIIKQFQEQKTTKN
jgi:hypothetical protein